MSKASASNRLSLLIDAYVASIARSFPLILLWFRRMKLSGAGWVGGVAAGPGNAPDTQHLGGAQVSCDGHRTSETKGKVCWHLFPQTCHLGSPHSKVLFRPHRPSKYRDSGGPELIHVLHCVLVSWWLTLAVISKVRYSCLLLLFHHGQSRSCLCFCACRPWRC